MTNLDKLKEMLKLMYTDPDVIISKFNRFKTDDYWSKEYDYTNDIYSWVYLDREYYYIDTTGGIEIAHHFIPDSKNEVNTLKKNIAIGNVFRYQIDAENELEHRKVCARLKELADCKFEEHNGDKDCWVIGFDALSNNDEAVHPIMFRGLTTSEFWFSSRESCKKAIETIGADNLKKYYFRIEEED